MAGDDVPDNEQPEIIPKPPSHPITTSLLIVGTFACLLGIGFVWNELFSCYLVGDKTAPADFKAGMENHTFAKEQALGKQMNPIIGPNDHYSHDFTTDEKQPEKTEKELIYDVKKDLHLRQSQEEAGG
jgi:hypothetical protein